MEARRLMEGTMSDSTHVAREDDRLKIHMSGPESARSYFTIASMTT